MREAITIRLLSHRFEKDEKAMRRRENDLALKFYRAIYSAADRKLMESIPVGWLPTVGSLRLAGGGYYSELHVADSLPVPFADHCQRYAISKIKGGDALSDLLDEFRERKAYYENEREALRKKTASTLAGFSTINRLVTAWPEIKPFVDQLGYDSEKKSLPAVIPADLNASLGLQAAA
jgi:hypothetical protein